MFSTSLTARLYPHVNRCCLPLFSSTCIVTKYDNRYVFQKHFRANKLMSCKICLIKTQIYIHVLEIHVSILQPCPPRSKDFRTLQCDSFNGIKYKGEKHEWVPVISDGKLQSKLQHRVKTSYGVNLASPPFQIILSSRSTLFLVYCFNYPNQ